MTGKSSNRNNNDNIKSICNKRSTLGNGEKENKHKLPLIILFWLSCIFALVLCIISFVKLSFMHLQEWVYLRRSFGKKTRKHALSCTYTYSIIHLQIKIIKRFHSLYFSLSTCSLLLWKITNFLRNFLLDLCSRHWSMNSLIRYRQFRTVVSFCLILL